MISYEKKKKIIIYVLDHLLLKIVSRNVCLPETECEQDLAALNDDKDDESDMFLSAYHVSSWCGSFERNAFEMTLEAFV